MAEHEPSIGLSSDWYTPPEIFDTLGLVFDLDPWMFDFAETDAVYLETYYRTGTIPAWEGCLVHGAAPFEPLPIPPLEHRRVDVQFAF